MFFYMVKVVEVSIITSQEVTNQIGTNNLKQHGIYISTNWLTLFQMKLLHHYTKSIIHIEFSIFTQDSKT